MSSFILAICLSVMPESALEWLSKTENPHNYVVISKLEAWNILDRYDKFNPAAGVVLRKQYMDYELTADPTDIWFTFDRVAYIEILKLIGD